jgi:signal transduction histidine kinase
MTLESRSTTTSPTTIRVDADRIQQIFSNLIGNALKFTPAGGTITVGATPADGRGRVLRPGHGAGALDREEIEHVFDRYWQARQQGSHGIGLGLSIARGMTEAHGGQIRVESEDGEGSASSSASRSTGAEGMTS